MFFVVERLKIKAQTWKKAFYFDFKLLTLKNNGFDLSLSFSLVNNLQII